LESSVILDLIGSRFSNSAVFGGPIMQHINVNNFQRKRQAVQLTWPVSDWRSDLLTSYTRYWAAGQTGAAAILIMFLLTKLNRINYCDILNKKITRRRTRLKSTVLRP